MLAFFFTPSPPTNPEAKKNNLKCYSPGKRQTQAGGAAAAAGRFTPLRQSPLPSITRTFKSQWHVATKSKPNLLIFIIYRQLIKNPADIYLARSAHSSVFTAWLLH